MEIAIEDFVKTATTPAVSEIYSDFDKIIENFEVDGIEDQLRELSLTRDLYDPIDLSDKVYSLFNNYLDEIIDNHEIELQKEVSLSDKVLFCKFLSNVQAWLDPTGIIRITESEASSEEKTAELAMMITSVSIERFMVMIQSVSDAFIIKLQSLYTSEQTDNREIIEVDPKLVSDMRLIFKYMEITDTVGYRLVKDGTPLGLRFDIYERYIKKHLEYQTNEMIAKQIFVLLYMSSDGYRAPYLMYQQRSDTMLHDIDKIAKVGVALKKLIADFVTLNTKLTLEKVNSAK